MSEHKLENSGDRDRPVGWTSRPSIQTLQAVCAGSLIHLVATIGVNNNLHVQKYETRMDLMSNSKSFELITASIEQSRLFHGKSYLIG